MTFIKKILLLFFIIILILPYHFIAKADATSGILISDNMRQMSNGSTVQYNTNSINGNYNLTAKITSKGLKKGYYSTIFYNALNNNMFNYGIVSFDIHNNSNSQLNINFMINKQDGTSLSIANDSYVLLKESSSALIKKLSPSNGSIVISKGFNGTVLIPLNALKQNQIQNTNQNTTSMIASLPSWWGILITSKENEKKDFTLSNFNLINADNKIQEIENLNVNFNGDTRVQIPVVGESIAKYSANIHDSNGNIVNQKITYKIDTPKKGISIDSNGMLKIKQNVSPQPIRIDAVIDNNLAFESKEIQLYKSWTLDAKELDGTSKSIPQTYEVKKILGSTYKFLMSDYVMNIIRISAVISLLLFIKLYLYWKKINYKEKKFNRKEYIIRRNRKKY
ncbi:MULTISPECIES: hypothetical protein [Clostridium]|uniref:hypothetical protein n=1 Tax=Clostridium TaxID=1485 RepID=UPI000826D546|nr:MULTISPECIES: hypothetical protein [Clostridium]PJI06708.1 hypothetical protein CUB90_01965 [Clostridium sp. CT7]